MLSYVTAPQHTLNNCCVGYFLGLDLSSSLLLVIIWTILTKSIVCLGKLSKVMMPCSTLMKPFAMKITSLIRILGIHLNHTFIRGTLTVILFFEG